MTFLIFLVLLYMAYLLYTINESIVTFGENFNEVVIDQTEREINRIDIEITGEVNDNKL